MARIRSIKPDFFTSETIARLPLSARLTFIGLWTHVDDNGVCIYNEMLITAALYPLDGDPMEALARVREDLRRISGEGLVTLYYAAGKRYLFVNSWDEHQKVSHPGKKRYPRPADGDYSVLTCGDADPPEGLPQSSGDPPETLRPEQGAGSREQGAGSREVASNEATQNLPAADAADEITDEPLPGFEDQTPDEPAPTKPRWTEPVLAALFDRFYKPYPRKKDPKDARRTFDKVVRAGADPELIIAGSGRFRLERAGKDPTFTPYPATWLNAGGWLSEADPPDPGPAAEADDVRRLEIDRAIHELQRTHPPCPHGSPGGLAPHPTLGFALCALCRHGVQPVDDPDQAGPTPGLAAAITEYRTAALVAQRRPGVPELLRITSEAKQLIAVGAPPGAVATVARDAGRHGTTLALAARCAQTIGTRGEAA